jgi:DNA-binding winged helix-turn-helix (wHTH) protein
LESGTQKRFGPFLLDGRERLLQRDGEPVPLPPKAFDLLEVFVEEPGRLLTKDELLKRLWPDTYVEESNRAGLPMAARSPFTETPLEGPMSSSFP